MTSTNLYGGWLHGDEDEKESLISLGVRGLITWSMSDAYSIYKKTGTFSNCVCDESVLEKLDKRYSEMWENRIIEEKERFFYYPPSKRFSKLSEDSWLMKVLTDGIVE